MVILMGKLAYGLAVRFDVFFDKVVEAVKSISEASNVYWEVINCNGKRVGVFVGEKYFFRAKNSLTLTIIVIEQPGYTVLRMIATGGRESLFDLFDLGASKDYVVETVEKLSRILGVEPAVIAEVEHLDSGKASMLHSM